jgi:hypothetical protein
MSQRAAFPINKTLIDRVDPLAGEVLSDQNPFNQPGVFRALIKASRIQRTIGPMPLYLIAPAEVTRASVAEPVQTLSRL